MTQKLLSRYVTLKLLDSIGNTPTCPICLDVLTTKSTRATECGHLYCYLCVKKQTRCGICRTPIISIQKREKCDTEGCERYISETRGIAGYKTNVLKYYEAGYCRELDCGSKFCDKHCCQHSYIDNEGGLFSYSYYCKKCMEKDNKPIRDVIKWWKDVNVPCVSRLMIRWYSMSLFHLGYNKV